MKIKEVCEKTGLSERAVRFYCEESLLTPERTEVRGRIYLEFDDEDVDVLRQIAVLRSAGFSVDEIRVAQNEPHLIGQLIDDLRERLLKEQRSQDRVLAFLNEISRANPPSNIEELTAQLVPHAKPKPYANGVALRDGEISFRAFCELGSLDAGDGAYDPEVAGGRIIFIGYSIWYWLGFVGVMLNLLGLAMAEQSGIFLSFLISAALYIWLYVYFCRGALWARILHIVRAALMVVAELFFLPMVIPHTETAIYHTLDELGNMGTETITEMSGSWAAFILVAVLLVFDLAAVYFLTFNAYLREYLYDRSTR